MTKKVLVLTTSAIAAGVAILAVGGFIPGLWICDLLSQFRLVYAVCLLLCLGVLILLRARISSLLCLIAFVLNTIPIGMMAVPRDCSPKNKTSTVSILNFNTEFQHNDNYGLFEQVVRQRSPDIIALVEVNQKWIDAIDVSTKRYPFRKIALAGAGMALFSKYPLEHTEVRYFGKSHHPRISTVTNVGGQKINLLIVHPPTPQSDGRYQERDQELNEIGDEIKSAAGPKILIGDLNCGPWAPAFERLLQVGLFDSEQGFGPQASWPARTGRVLENIPIPPLIPIDHILASDDICVSERQAGPAIQSDHLPIFIRLTIGNPANLRAHQAL